MVKARCESGYMCLYLQVAAKSLCMLIRSYLYIPFHSQHKHILSWTSSMLKARCQILLKQDHTVALNFQVIMILKIFLQFHAQELCLTMAVCIHALTPSTLWLQKSENLDKFHYLWVSLSSFIILKMESARFSGLTITGTNA